MSPTTQAEILTLLQGAGEVVKFACPGCGALVDLAEAVASGLVHSPSKEKSQMQQAVADIDAADALLESKIATKP